MPEPTDDLETKVEDAFVMLLEKEAAPEIKGIYPWAEQGKLEPCIVVKATRGEANTKPQGDIVRVSVEVTLRHARTGVRRGLMRCVEDAVGTLQDTPGMKGLPARLSEASSGSLHIWDEPNFAQGDKSFDENKISRSLIVDLWVAHKC